MTGLDVATVPRLAPAELVPREALPVPLCEDPQPSVI